MVQFGEQTEELEVAIPELEFQQLNGILPILERPGTNPALERLHKSMEKLEKISRMPRPKTNCAMAVVNGVHHEDALCRPLWHSFRYIATLSLATVQSGAC